MSHEARLAELKIVLPTPPKAMGTYATCVRHRDLLFVSGTGPLLPDGTYITGKVGAGLDLSAAREAARLAGLAMLATVRAQLGTLDPIVRVVKVLGLVNATPDFTEHPQVINGFSDLMVQIFGPAGLAARSAIGAPSLPAGIPVEIEAIFEIAGETVMAPIAARGRAP